VDVGLSLINAGLAWHYRAYEREQSRSDREQYRLAEDGARTRKDGLWTDAVHTPPWDWRRARRDGKTSRH
jgi:endonuclease YncB( thermonuclease family)